MIQKRSEGVGAAGAVVPDAPFGPAAVIDGVVRLHGSDHVQLRKAVKVLGGHVLRMFDTEAPVRARHAPSLTSLYRSRIMEMP